MSEESPGLPAAWYTRPEIFARERRAIFAGAWQLLGRRDQLKKPGDYLAATLGGWSVFAMLDEEGRLGAFQNVCRHQGLPVLDAGAGNCEALRCRYHGWTYDREGRFVKAPPAVAPADPAEALHHLQRIADTTAAGLIFVRSDGDQTTLDPAIKTATEAFSCVGDVAIDIDANWKLIVENRVSGNRERLQWWWPTLLIEPFTDSACVYQIIARSFRRTRLVSHVYTGNPSTVASLLAAATSNLGAIKASCEEQQRALETGVPPSAEPRLAYFHARVRGALSDAGASRAHS